VLRARIAVVQIGMTLPVMEPDLDATVLKNWARIIDDGPFSSLCWGERIAFDNPDSLTLLGAKAVGVDPRTQTMRGMVERIDIMKRVWAGEKVTESVLPVSPAPVRKGGPRLLIGAIGTKTTRSAASRAQAGKPPPHLGTSFWFAIGEGRGPRVQMHRHLRRYMNWIPAEDVDAMAPTTGWAGAEDSLVETLRAFEAIGTDEIHLIPTSSDPDQLRRVADVVKDFR
jgi:hypothetical protein